MSKAAVTHTFRKLKTPSRCRECDSYVYFQGLECIEVCSMRHLFGIHDQINWNEWTLQCGLSCHKKCLESLTIQCGHKRLPRKMTTFGVDLSQHLSETRTNVPPIMAKCINEIDARGIHTKVTDHSLLYKHRYGHIINPVEFKLVIECRDCIGCLVWNPK